MTLYRDDIVHVDPTSKSDVLSASPATNAGACHGTITVTQGAHFPWGATVTNYGRSQSVCIPADQVQAVLAKLGSRLLGLRKGDNRVIVTTTEELQHLRDELKARYSSEDTVYYAINDLIDALTGGR